VIAITCVRVNATDGFDNSQSLIVVKGSVVSDNALTSEVNEINGIPVATTPKKTLPYQDKKWVVVGDSLTEKNIRTTIHYHDYVAKELGFNVVNMGRSGTGYKRTEEQSLAFYQRILTIPIDVDVVTVFGSFNDLGGGYALGTPTDTGTTTICGCMNTFFDNYYSVLPTTPIGVVTPTPWVGNYPGMAGADNYVNALIEICKKRSIPYLDLYRGSNLRPWDAEFRTLAYSKDGGNGVHPDETGHKIISAPYREFVKSLI
jgi:lysophospholipase L1-like esterase